MLTNDRLDPRIAIRRERLHDGLCRFRRDATFEVDLPEFGALLGWISAHGLERLDPSEVTLVQVSLGREVAAHGHREAIRDQVGESQDDHDCTVEPCANRARHHREGGDGAVHGAEHSVT